MHRYLRNILLVILAVGLFSACNRLPDHVRYIPKDATAVAGINLKSLSKKIAWNMITGSKLFKEMQKRIPEKKTKDAMSGIEKAGIDVLNTFYVYIKTDTRFRGGNRITGLVPLSDAGQWEAYVKQTFPDVEIRQNGDRKEANLGNNMYVGWKKNLLIIINVMPAAMDYSDPGMDNNGQGNPGLDMAAISAEMDNAFNVTKENSIAGNKRFTDLETQGHDLTFWLNYDQLMSQYMSGNMAQKMGVTLSNSLWKDAGFTAGFDFVKGKITGDMHYFMSDEMKTIGMEFGANNADKDMIDRLPNQNMDVVMTTHASPKGIKGMMDKTGMLGLANVGLSTQGLNMDNVLDAFTGDVAFIMNDFSLHTERITDSFMGQTVVRENQKPSLNMSYVMKINKKDEFQKLVNLAKQLKVMQDISNGYAIPIDDKDSVYIMINDQYLVVSNKLGYANGFLQGSFKSQKMPEPVATQVSGHPMALYVDIQQMFKNIDASISHSSHDSAMIEESKKLLSNMSFTGGAFKESAFEYHLDINFINTEENSIIQLMDYGIKLSDAGKIAQNSPL